MSTKKAEQITKRFPADDQIQGNVLSLNEKLGQVELELNRPVEMEGDQPDVSVVVVEAPTTENMIIFDNRDQSAKPEEKAKVELQFYGTCCVNIPADKLSAFHPMDARRLQRLVTNFVQSA